MEPGGTRVSGAILTGGQSRRMGQTKALVEVDGTPMALRVARALRTARCEEIFLVGGDSAELGGLGLTVVADLHPGDGPVGGVLTALRHASTDHVLIVACDLPYLTPATTQQLVAAADARRVVVATTDRIQPTLALWPSSALEVVEQAFESGARSMRRLLDDFDVIGVPVEPADVVNINSPSDL